jgi:hypothetical protein
MQTKYGRSRAAAGEQKLFVPDNVSVITYEAGSKLT